jgi:6-phosphogluconolactonase (cycloisomerase 2 family)
VVGDRVYVANQASDSITVLRIDLETGELTGTASRFGTPSPTQVLPMPDRPTERS